MEISSETLENGVVKVNLAGRMDIQGIQAIEMKFIALTTTKQAFVVVDMAEVGFLASLGMRVLISSAKAQSARGGRIVLYRPQPNVKHVLETAGVSSLINIYEDLEPALSALGLPPHIG